MECIISPDELPLWVKVVVFTLLVGMVAITGVSFRKQGRNETIIEDSSRNEKYEETIKEQEREAELQRLYSFCEHQRGQEVCKAIADSGVAVESSLEFEGLARFAVALARNEQNYRCPDFNCYGLGAFDQFHWLKFSSYHEATVYLADLLREKKINEITPNTIRSFAGWYKGGDKEGCRLWAEKINFMIEQIK